MRATTTHQATKPRYIKSRDQVEADCSCGWEMAKTGNTPASFKLVQSNLDLHLSHYPGSSIT